MPLHEILSTIKQYETIIIHHHIRPDPDALGSSAALKEILLASFPEKNVYLAGEEDPALRFLTPLDDITDEMYDGALVIVCDTADRKSTRLNSSHVAISYAIFCLKKKYY